MKVSKIAFFIGITISLGLASEIDNDFDFDSAETEVIDISKKENKVSNIEIEVAKDSAIIEEVKKQNIEVLDNGHSDFGVSQNIDISNDFKDVISIDKGFKLKKYTNIRYVPQLNIFSVYNPKSSDFDDLLMENNIRKSDFLTKLQKKDISSDKMIFLSAFYYDFVKKDPTLAENYYLKFSTIKNRTIRKLRLADYMLRTGRYKGLRNLINHQDLDAYFGCKGAYFYYYKGVFEYLNTKNKENLYMKQANKCKIKKAKRFFY